MKKYLLQTDDYSCAAIAYINYRNHLGEDYLKEDIGKINKLMKCTSEGVLTEDFQNMICKISPIVVSSTPKHLYTPYFFMSYKAKCGDLHYAFIYKYEDKWIITNDIKKCSNKFVNFHNKVSLKQLLKIINRKETYLYIPMQ